jgi:hypothetical protein
VKGLFDVVRRAVNRQTIDLIKNSLEIERESLHRMTGIPLVVSDPNDQCVPGNHFNKYSSLVAEGMLLTLLPLIQNVTGKRLYPTYSFTRYYFNGTELRKHKDRPSCEYSMTLCIESDPAPWGIWVEGTEVLLNPGDLVVYRGCDAEHWRLPYTGNRTIQMFLHYVDIDGPYSNYLFDRRDALGMPPLEQKADYK